LAQIVLKDVVKQFGAQTAVKGVNLQVRDGEFLIMVGPSGCGKTTTLNMISGLERPTSGEIAIGGQVVNDLEPGERGLGMVFQDLALFPHLTVYENIAFGMRVKKVAEPEIDSRVRAAADAMHISALLDKRPAQCSGGESQRVALARTIVTNPSVFLMDEPLSSLDAKLRVDMRTELKRLHDRLSATFVYVTHDQAEAMTMADRIVVMSRGLIEQVGAPLEIYRKPATQFVAGFFGTPTMNFLSGSVEAADGAPLTSSESASKRSTRSPPRFATHSDPFRSNARSTGPGMAGPRMSALSSSIAGCSAPPAPSPARARSIQTTRDCCCSRPMPGVARGSPRWRGACSRATRSSASASPRRIAASSAAVSRSPRSGPATS